MVVNAGIYVNVLKEPFGKVNGQLNKVEAAKGKNFGGKHCRSRTLVGSRPCVKKPLETSVKHPKCCNHYLDKERTHIVLLNKSVSKTKVSDNIWKGLIKVNRGACCLNHL